MTRTHGLSRFFGLSLLTLAGLASSGCSDDAAADAGDGDGLLASPAAGQGLQLGMQARIEGGEEIEYCQYVVLPDDVDVGWFEHRYSPGSHHLLLYTTTLEAKDVDASMTERFDCASRDDLALGGIAYAAQVPEGKTAFPDGVAMHFAKQQVVMLQTHYLNATSAAMDADVRLNLWKSTGPMTQEAGTLFFYDYSIVVPAHGKSTAAMSCAIREDIEITFAMSHMHRRGVAYHSRLLQEGAAPRSLYDTDQWEGVEPLVLDPPLPMKTGDVVEFECDFVNATGDTIIEGPSAAKNEMCMFVATYWPRMELADELCARPGSGPVHHGDRTCAETMSCVQATQDPIERESCQIATCQGSSKALGGINQCVFEKCPACLKGEKCDACVVENCLSEYQACQAASCGDD